MTMTRITRGCTCFAIMNLPNCNALDPLEELNGARNGSEWIFLTRHGGVPYSVRAPRLGALEFVEKPCERERLDMIVNGATGSAKRCVLFSQGEEFPARWRQFKTADDSRNSKPVIKEGQAALLLDGSMPLDAIDELIIKTVLKRSNDNLTAAARLLGNTRGTLRYRIQPYGLK